MKNSELEKQQRKTKSTEEEHLKLIVKQVVYARVFEKLNKLDFSEEDKVTKTTKNLYIAKESLDILEKFGIESDLGVSKIVSLVLNDWIKNAIKGKNKEKYQTKEDKIKLIESQKRVAIKIKETEIEKLNKMNEAQIEKLNKMTEHRIKMLDKQLTELKQDQKTDTKT